MLKKTCPHCQSNSYSSTARGQLWLCPNCGEDISHIPTEAPLPPLKVERSQEVNEKSMKDVIQQFLKRIKE